MKRGELLLGSAWSSWKSWVKARTLSLREESVRSSRRDQRSSKQTVATVPVGGVGFERPITEQLRVSALWIGLSAPARAPQRVRPRPYAQFEGAGAAVGALGTLAGEVTGLVGFDRAVGVVVQVGGQRVPLLRLAIFTTFKYTHTPSHF